MSVEEREQLLCPRCSAGVEPGQEYCLECGLRLPHDRPGALERASTGVATRLAWTGTWLLPSLLGLVIAVLGTGAAIAISSHGAERTAITIAIGGSPAAPRSTPTITPPEPNRVPPASRRPRSTTPRPAKDPDMISWPTGQRGWTIVLISLPQTGGRAAPKAKAAEARRGGLRRIGILDSSRYASLHPGYYVVFQGVYESETDAVSSLQRAHTVFPAAYQRAIVP